MEAIKSKLWELSRSDLVKGLKVAVWGALLGALYSAFKAYGLHLGVYDWHAILGAAASGGISYLFHKFTSDESGKTFGKI